MRKMRNLHLWIGLICSIFILIEAVTGLLLTEPWLMGGQSMERPQMGQGFQGFPGGQAIAPGSQQDGQQNGGTTEFRGQNRQQFGKREGFGDAGSNGGLMGFIRQLHEGRIGGTNLKIFADIAAIAMILLTLTGIFLSIKTLRAQSLSRIPRQTPLFDSFARD